jgi:hypothetical protein
MFHCKKIELFLVLELFSLSGFLLTIGPLPVIEPLHPQAPMPIQVNIGRSSDYWMAGAVCTPFYWYFATEVSVIIKTPSQAPPSNRWYWIGLSCWDSNWSYDQIGYGEYGGNWRFYFSRSIYTKNNELKCLPEAPYVLNLGTTYKYVMKIYSNGYLYYKLYKKSGSSWNLIKLYSRKTGGTGFFVTWRITTSYGDTYVCFTNWEETNNDNNPAPSFDIKFIDTRVDGTGFSSWIDLFAGEVPDGIDIEYGWEEWPYTRYVKIDNP